jgi:hypothetical protein
MVKSTGVASGGIVHQVLTKDNYERWKSVMENYLKGQDLWDDIIIDTKKDAADIAIPKKKDAADTDKPIKDPVHQASKKTKEGKNFHMSKRKKKQSKASFNNNFNNQNGFESKAIPDIEQGDYL